MVIAMVVIMIAAVGIDKGMKYYEDRKWEKERIYHYEQARADIANIQTRISELSSDREAIEAFIEENRAYFDDMEVPGQDDTDQVRMRETLQQRKTCPAIPFPEMIFPGIPFREMMFPETICPAIAFRSVTFPATIFQGIPFPVMIFPEMTLLERSLQKEKKCRARTL